MNFNQLNNIEFLHSVQHDEQKLISLVKDTQGFIFFFLEKHSILPPLDILIKNPSTGGLNFILKNYTLTQQQSVEISHHFSDKTQIIEQKIDRSISLEERVKNNAPVFKDTILDYTTIKNTQEAIIKIIREESDYNFKELFVKSLELLTKEEILSFEQLIKEIPFESMPKKFLSDEHYNKIYLNNLEHKIQDYERMGSQLLQKTTLNEKNLKLLHKVISREFSPKYANYEKISGFTHLITPMDFFAKYNCEDLTPLSLEDIKTNLEAVRKGLFKDDVLKNVDYYDNIENNLHKLDYIIDDNLLKDFFSQKYMFSVFSEPKKASILMLEKIADYFVRHPSADKIKKMYDYVNYMQKIDKEKYDRFLLSYYNVCAQNDIMEKFYYSSDGNYLSLLESKEWNGSMNINKLYITLTLSCKYTHSERFKSVLIQMLSQVDYEEGAILLDIFNLEEFKEYLDVKNNIKNSFFEKNILPKDVLEYFSQDNNYLENIIKTKREMPIKFISDAIESDQIEFLRKYNEIYPLDLTNYSIQEILKKPWSKVVLGDNSHRETQMLEDFLNSNKDNAPIVSAEIVTKKIEQLFEERDFALLMKLYSNYSNEQFKKSFSTLTKEEIDKLIDNKDFLKCISIPLNHYKSYGEEPDFCIDFTVKSLKKFINKNKKVADSQSKHIFSYVKDTNILKDYLAKHEPIRFFYEYYSYQRNDLVHDHKSLITAFTNAQKNNKFFSFFDSNVSFKEPISNLSLQELVLFEKEARKYPILYLGLSMHKVKNYEWFEKSEKSSDELWHDFMVNNMDLDIILQGVKDVIKCVIESDSSVNKAFALDTIMSFLYNTYYDRRKENSYDTETVSNFSEEQTKKVMQFFLKEAPNLVINTYRICGLNSKEKVVSYLEEGKYNIHELMSSQVTPSGLRENDIQDFVDAIIDKKIKEQDILSLCYISYMIEQNKFEKNIQYGTGVLRTCDNLIYSYKDEGVREKLDVFETKFFLTHTLLEGKVNSIKKVNKL